MPSAAENHEINRIGNMPIVNKQMKFLTAFLSIQMHRAKLALAMSWRGNYRHFQKAHTKGYALN